MTNLNGGVMGVNFRHAQYQRVDKRGDSLWAEVEVQLNDEGGSLVVWFTDSKDQDYDIVMILQKDAELDVDWYDNNLHQAYVDVTESLFADDSGETLWKLRETFKEDVLNYGDVREQLDKHMKQSTVV
jgi:hypothetical protein